jgi:hypothetical protein
MARFQVLGCMAVLLVSAAPAAAQYGEAGKLQDALQASGRAGTNGPSNFDEIEPVIVASPASTVALPLAPGMKLRDFEVSPIGDAALRL